MKMLRSLSRWLDLRWKNLKNSWLLLAWSARCTRYRLCGDLQGIEQPHDPLRRTAPTLRIRAGHHAPGRDGIIVERVHRSAVMRSDCSNRLHDRDHLVLSQLVQDVENEFAFDREAGHRLALDDGFARLRVDDARHDCRPMTDSADDAPSIPDVRSNGLQSLGGRVVIER